MKGGEINCNELINCSFCHETHYVFCDHVNQMSIRIPGVGTRFDEQSWRFYNDENLPIKWLCDNCLYESGLANDPWIAAGTRQDRTVVTELFLRNETCRLDTIISHAKFQQKQAYDTLDMYDMDSEARDREELDLDLIL
jgi:hypothetical protein